MTSDRFPLPDEVDAPTPELGPAFRRRVLTQVRQARGRRRMRRQLTGVALFAAVVALSSMTWLRQETRAIAPVTSSSPHWNQALEGDLTWLEETESQRTSSGEDAQSTSNDRSGARSLRYFFPEYQDLSTEGRN
jgi:hypothetical protein